MRRARRATITVALLALAVPAALAAVTSASAGSISTHSSRVLAPKAAARPPAAAHGTRPIRRGIPGAAPATAAPRRFATGAGGRLVAEVRPGRTVAVRGRPGGPVLARMAVTQFGSRVTFPVLARRGRWAGVPATNLPNGRLGWIDARGAGLAWQRTRKTIVIDVARRRLELRDGPRTLLTGTVGVGAPGTPTPHGRFAITDKLSGSRYSAAYGCCILALSGHQTHLPAGWRGGDRLAIHGTNAPSTIGRAVTTGCLHAAPALVRALMRRVPLGTPVVIR